MWDQVDQALQEELLKAVILNYKYVLAFTINWRLINAGPNQFECEHSLWNVSTDTVWGY